VAILNRKNEPEEVADLIKTHGFFNDTENELFKS